MVKPIFQLIDAAYHDGDKTDRDEVESRLIRAHTLEYATSDGYCNDRWRKAVRKYMDELDRVEEWNKISMEFNKK